jgi:HAD superfamily hydrolase (TIGR01549 family)
MAVSSLMHNQYKGLLFDFDGTLLDSFSVHYEVYKIMFARFGIQITKEKFLGIYSPDWYQTYQAMGLPRDVWDMANSYWVEEAEKQTPELFSGIPEMLSQLHGSYMLGLVTSGSKNRVLKDLERTGIQRFFKTVVTANDVHKPKPSSEALELALGNLGLRPDEAVYIGDSYADYKMAQAAKVNFLGVTSAFASLSLDSSDYRVCAIIDLAELFRE